MGQSVTMHHLHPPSLKAVHPLPTRNRVLALRLRRTAVATITLMPSLASWHRQDMVLVVEAMTILIATSTQERVLETFLWRLVWSGPSPIAIPSLLRWKLTCQPNDSIPKRLPPLALPGKMEVHLPVYSGR